MMEITTSISTSVKPGFCEVEEFFIWYTDLSAPDATLKSFSRAAAPAGLFDYDSAGENAITQLMTYQI